MTNENILNIEKINLSKDDILVVSVNNDIQYEEAYTILNNLKDTLNEHKLDNIIVITTPGVRLSTLTPEELKEIGLQKI